MGQVLEWNNSGSGFVGWSFCPDHSDGHQYRLSYDIYVGDDRIERRNEDRDSFNREGRHCKDGGDDTVIFIGLNPSNAGIEEMSDGTCSKVARFFWEENFPEFSNGVSGYKQYRIPSFNRDSNREFESFRNQCRHIVFTNLFPELCSDEDDFYGELVNRHPFKETCEDRYGQFFGGESKEMTSELLDAYPNAPVICAWGAVTAAGYVESREVVKIAIDKLRPKLPKHSFRLGYKSDSGFKKKPNEYDCCSWSPNFRYVSKVEPKILPAKFRAKSESGLSSQVVS